LRRPFPFSQCSLVKLNLIISLRDIFLSCFYSSAMYKGEKQSCWNTTMRCPCILTCTHKLFLSLTHSLSLSHTHTHTLSLSLSLTHTHTHTHRHNKHILYVILTVSLFCTFFVWDNNSFMLSNGTLSAKKHAFFILTIRTR